MTVEAVQTFLYIQVTGEVVPVTLLTSGTHERKAADIRGVVSSIDSSHVATHGGAYKVKGLFVQLKAFYKLGREMKRRCDYS